MSSRRPVIEKDQPESPGRRNLLKKAAYSAPVLVSLGFAAELEAARPSLPPEPDSDPLSPFFDPDQNG